MRRFTLAVAFLVVPSLAVLPSVSQAQVRGGSPAGGGHAMISAPRASAYAAPMGHAVGGSGTVYRATPGHVSRAAGAVTTTGRRTFSNRPAGRTISAGSTMSAFGPANSLPDFTGAVPGLGFDYVHFANVHPGLGIHRFPFGRHGFFPFFDVGFLLPYGYGPGYFDTSDEAQAAQYQPSEPADVSTDDPGAGRQGPAYAPQPAAPAYDVIVEPQKPSEQYVFVRRDGSVFFAVAYSWQAGNLYYVTQDGFRNSVAREALDLDATQQFNEQRGLSFQAPARS
jgi:hypothetical protein